MTSSQCGTVHHVTLVSWQHTAAATPSPLFQPSSFPAATPPCWSSSVTQLTSGRASRRPSSSSPPTKSVAWPRRRLTAGLQGSDNISDPSRRRLPYSVTRAVDCLCCPSPVVCRVCASVPLLQPCAGSGVERIDPLRFLAGCRTRRLNQALSGLSLSLVRLLCC